MKGRAKLLALLALIAPVPRSTAGDEAQDVKDAGVRPSREELMDSASRKLEELQGKIRTRRKEALDKRREQLERLRKLNAEKRAVERTLEAVEKDKTRLQKEAEKKKEKLASLEEEKNRLEDESKDLNAVMKAYLERVKRRVKDGIPWQIEQRASSIDQAAELAESTSNPAGLLAAVGRVQSEEEAMARLVETGIVRVEKDGESFDVSSFHLGLLAVVFASDDGAILGFARAGETLEDGLRAVENDPAAAEGYLRAVDILRRRRTPSLVDLYFPSLPAKSDGSR